MKTRRRCLPEGWYPSSPDAIRRRIGEFLADCPPSQPGAPAVVAPHAGWEYSGAPAAAAAASLRAGAQTVVVVGGHLGPRDGVCAAFEELLDTPLGPARTDDELLEAVRRRIPVAEDRVPDNTVEVQLPLVRALLPAARVVAFRAPPSGRARELGEAVHLASRELGRDVVLLGSTDLTHYGPSYDFTPKGSGEAAVRWVREVNDRRFIEAVVALDGEEAIRLALHERSACSPGAAAAAIAFARAGGAAVARLLHYRTSYDVTPAASFVGYAAVLLGG